MALSYEPLWRFLDKIHLSKMEFAERVGISNATLAKLGKNEPITLTIIEKICTEFNCSINDIVTHVRDKSSLIPLELLEKGVVVNCQCYPLGTKPLSRALRTSKAASLTQPCVIIHKPENRSTFLIAPLNLKKDPETMLDIPFYESTINNTTIGGYIQLSKLGIIPARNIEKIVGKIPKHVIDFKIMKILQDLIPILIKYEIVHTTLLYNLGLIDDTESFNNNSLPD